MSNQTQRKSRHQFQIEELLASLPEGAAFVSTSGQAFLTLPGGQTFPLSSAYTRDWLIGQYFNQHGESPTDHAVHQGIRTLRAQAHARPRPRPVDVRIVAAPSAIYIDLANRQGDAVRITQNGWEITTALEVAFRSSRGQLPLPHPTKNDERTTMNAILQSEAIREWLVAALKPTGPYPILVLHGPPGSGKTTTARMLRALIDPVIGPIQPLPSRGREIHELAVRDRVLVFDHVTRMSNSVADALCQISSGTGVSIKEAGDRNREPLRLDIARPIIVTTPSSGIKDWQPRPDIAARAITVEMSKIENPRAAQEIWTEFEAARPALLGTLYTALSEQWNRPPAEERATKNEKHAPSNEERATKNEEHAASNEERATKNDEHAPYNPRLPSG